LKDLRAQQVATKIKFFNIASASLSELTYGIHAAFRLGYIDQPMYQRLEEHTRMVAAPLNGLIRRERLGSIGKASGSTVTLALLIIVALG
jgi:four helix bundle protein